MQLRRGTAIASAVVLGAAGVVAGAPSASMAALHVAVTVVTEVLGDPFGL